SPLLEGEGTEGQHRGPVAYPWARSIARWSARWVYTRVRCRRYSAEAWISPCASIPSVARAAACVTASAVAACPCRTRSVALARKTLSLTPVTPTATLCTVLLAPSVTCTA